MQTLLYEAANVILTRYKSRLKLKDWAFAMAKRLTMRKARIAKRRTVVNCKAVLPVSKGVWTNSAGAEHGRLFNLNFCPYRL